MSIWTTVPAQVMPSPAVPVISVGNLKGGVGKTTLVANLAMALVQSGLRVLAIDLDFQASLSVALPSNVMPRYEKLDGGMSILMEADYDIFHDSQITAQGVKPFEDLSLVRTSLELAIIEDMLFAGFVLRKYSCDPRFALARKLSDPRLKKDFDIVLIDTPPRLTMGSINALCASTHVIIPTALTPLSESGATTFVEYINKFADVLCPKIDILGAVPTLTRGTLNDAERKVLERLARVLPHGALWGDLYIPHRQAIADNNAWGHAESREKFKRLADRVISALGLHPHGANDDRRTYRGAQIGGYRLSQ